MDSSQLERHSSLNLLVYFSQQFYLMDGALDCLLLKQNVCILRSRRKSFPLACILWFRECHQGETDGSAVFDEVFHQASIVANPESILHHIHSFHWMHHFQFEE